MENKIKLLALLTIGILLPSFCLGQTSQTAGPPQTLEGVKEIGLKALRFFPDILKKALDETINWLKKVWQSYFYPFLHRIWQKIDTVFGKEIRERKPIIKEEFKKETEEMKQEVPLLSKSLWEKLKEFFKIKK